MIMQLKFLFHSLLLPDMASAGLPATVLTAERTRDWRQISLCGGGGMCRAWLTGVRRGGGWAKRPLPEWQWLACFLMVLSTRVIVLQEALCPI